MGHKGNPLFSILIANYNNGCYLQEAVDSVLIQDYSNWEIVLVDDGSSDNSINIYDKYKDDPRFRIYYNDRNKGCGYTKRRCVELAGGELCGFLDPDDKLVSQALSVMVKAHHERPQCSLIYSTSFFWDDLKETITFSEVIGPMQNGEDFLVTSKYNVFQFASFKKSAYDKTAGIDAELRSLVDVDLYYRLEEVGGVFYIDEPLYYYRQTNPNSISIGVHKDNYMLSKCRAIVPLNAFVRRIRIRSLLFLNNEEKYVFRMRWLLGTYKRVVKHVDWPLINYCFWYWRACGCSLHSLNHVRKVLLIRVK